MWNCWICQFYHKKIVLVLQNNKIYHNKFITKRFLAFIWNFYESGSINRWFSKLYYPDFKKIICVAFTLAKSALYTYHFFLHINVWSMDSFQLFFSWFLWYFSDILITWYWLHDMIFIKRWVFFLAPL